MNELSHSPSYHRAGVNIKKGESLVDAIKSSTKRTKIPGCIGNIGGFGALFDLKATNIKDPILVSCTDGVGTKLLAAIKMDKHKTIGIDLVAMCVNDLIVQGALPLFFLDYIASSHLKESTITDIVEGIAYGCQISGCALTGGEMAEMPGMYSEDHYDLAGFCVGAADREKLLPSHIAPGDTVIALPSSGIHANGFSLVRKIMGEQQLNFHDKAPYKTHTIIGDDLLTPTKIYVKQLLSLQRQNLIKGAAHITGGGLYDNVPRILPAHTQVRIDKNWTIPPLFRWLSQAGKVSPQEMLRVFNCGIGMIVITNKPQEVHHILHQQGEESFTVGHIHNAPSQQETTSIYMDEEPDFNASVA